MRSPAADHNHGCHPVGAWRSADRLQLRPQTSAESRHLALQELARLCNRSLDDDEEPPRIAAAAGAEVAQGPTVLTMAAPAGLVLNAAKASRGAAQVGSRERPST